MTKMAALEPRFVEAMPATLEDGVLYVSMIFNTVVHKCCCGCGIRVVTPLSPAEWRLEYDGYSVTLYPSIGNHQYLCRSHYWIRRNRVEWSSAWTKREIDEGRTDAHRARQEWYDSHRLLAEPLAPNKVRSEAPAPSWWSRLIRRWRRVGVSTE